MPVKPIDKEEEYYARIEFERSKKIEMEKHKNLAEGEKQRLRNLHLRCPKCGMELIEINHEGILVDKCSTCEGIWLAAGEL